MIQCGALLYAKCFDVTLQLRGPEHLQLPAGRHVWRADASADSLRSREHPEEASLPAERCTTGPGQKRTRGSALRQKDQAHALRRQVQHNLLLYSLHRECNLSLPLLKLQRMYLDNNYAK